MKKLNLLGKRTAFLIGMASVLCICLFPQGAFAQQKQTGEGLRPSDFGIMLGYGTHGLLARLDLNLSSLAGGREGTVANTHAYLDLGADGYSFSEPNFTFDGTNYSSGVFLYDIGGGLAEEIAFSNGHLLLTPFVGVRYEKARFADQSLLDAIGTNGINRYERDAYGNQYKVGPTVANGYGDVTTIDLGVRLGFRFCRLLEVTGTAAFAPIKYSTSGTLFGQYWGESPYANNYRIDRPAVRLEGGVRFNF